MASVRLQDARWVGLAGPLVKKSLGYLTPSTDLDLIKSSVELILGTRIGEYPMRPTFGSQLYKVPFNQNDDITRAIIEEFVIEAISKWEPRVNIVGFDIARNPSDNEVRVKINFTVKEFPVSSFDVQFALERS